MIEQLAQTAEGGDGVVRVSWNIYAWACDALGVGQNGRYVLMIVSVLLCVIVPYLLGSINPSIIFSKRLHHEDIRDFGSGNAGTTNILRTYGKGMAILVFCCDLLKAAVAVIFGALMLTMSLGGAIAGFFVIFGHAFPIYYKFRGGKGVACTAMVVLLLHPLTFLILLVIFAIIVIFTKYVSLASIMSVALYPLISWAFLKNTDDGGIAMFAIFTAVLVIFMHRENLKRLWAGKESKISFKKTDKHGVDEQGENEKKERIYTDADFVKCKGCGQTIPITREKCVYCGEINPYYVPRIDEDKKKNGRKKKK